MLFKTPQAYLTFRRQAKSGLWWEASRQNRNLSHNLFCPTHGKFPNHFCVFLKYIESVSRPFLLPDPDCLHLLTAFCSQMETADGCRAHDPLSDERGWSVFIFSTLHMLFNWCTVALQCCVSFCSTAVTQLCTYISSYFGSPSRLGHHRELSRAPCDIQ